MLDSRIPFFPFDLVIDFSIVSFFKHQTSDMAEPQELTEFKQYLHGKGKNYDGMTDQQLVLWGEAFDKYKALQAQSSQAGKY